MRFVAEIVGYITITCSTLIALGILIYWASKMTLRSIKEKEALEDIVDAMRLVQQKRDLERLK